MTIQLHEYPAATWRILRTAPAGGAWNMAVDEAILESVGGGESRPTLRLYSWNPPCLSLGYAQPAGDADMEQLSNHGWDIVRRITGGRAILHADELTYAVIGPPNEPRLVGGVLESYRRLSQALLSALQLLGLPAQALPQPQGAAHAQKQKPVCFEVPSNYEITVGGKKLIGSAQSRKKSGVLPHGSLPLSGDLTRITQALFFPDAASRLRAAERLLAHAANVESITGEVVSWEAAAAAFETAFSRTLNLNLEPGGLTAAELKRADELVNEKYAHPEWIGRI